MAKGADVGEARASPTLEAYTLEGASGDTVNACGVAWAEWLDGVYYDTVQPTLQSPLALLVFARGSADLDLLWTSTCRK